jgi:hypothetical protein
MAKLNVRDKAPAFSLSGQDGKGKIVQASYKVKPLDTVPNATEVLG